MPNFVANPQMSQINSIHGFTGVPCSILISDFLYFSFLTYIGFPYILNSYKMFEIDFVPIIIYLLPYACILKKPEYVFS